MDRHPKSLAWLSWNHKCYKGACSGMDVAACRFRVLALGICVQTWLEELICVIFCGRCSFAFTLAPKAQTLNPQVHHSQAADVYRRF